MEKSRFVELGDGSKVVWQEWCRKVERFNWLKYKLFGNNVFVVPGEGDRDWEEYNGLCLLLGPVFKRMRDTEALVNNSLKVGC